MIILNVYHLFRVQQRTAAAVGMGVSVGTDMSSSAGVIVGVEVGVGVPVRGEFLVIFISRPNVVFE